jgi:uncharacterized protein (DUF1015 family)
MPIVRPFAGLLYDQAVAGPPGGFTAPPYDTISPIDQDRYHRASPYNIVRLILGRDEPTDDRSSNKYTRSGEYLRAWLTEGVLRPTGRPAMFPYRMGFHLGGVDRSIRGVIAEVELEPWGGSIVPHERTMPGPIEDRLKLLREVRTNLSPVYSVFTGPSGGVASFLDAAMAASPEQQVADTAGTEHSLWVATDDTDAVTEALRSESLLIADGHHRYAVALAYRQEMRARFGSGPWDAMMMLIVDGSVEDPPVLPIHRVVQGGDPAIARRGERVRDMAEVLASLDDDRLIYGTVELEEGEPIHRVARLDGPPPVVCALHEAILDRPEGLQLRFVPDAAAAEQAVRSGEASSAFLLPPTRVERVRSVIQGGGVLPQKSTYFWPKPRTGMVLRPLDGEG